MGRYDVKERNAEGQMVVDFVKRIAVANGYFKKRDEFRVTYLEEWRTMHTGDHILSRKVSLKEIGDCKVVTKDGDL